MSIELKKEEDQGRADLHMHSVYSDGILQPEALFKKAKIAGLKAISITDHDNVEACIESHTLKTKYNIDFINGVEFSCFEDREYHILGYNIDIDNKALKKHIVSFREARLLRAEQIISKLSSLGVELSMSTVLEHAGAAPIARPHIGAVIVKEGYSKSLKTAFNKYLGDRSPAYCEKKHFAVSKAIDLINKSGGVAVLAHPGKMVTQEMLYKMIEMGLDGIEVIHPSHDNRLENYYDTIAAQFWLLATGGSDYHGSREYDQANFGKFTVPYSVVESIRYLAGKG